MATLSGPIRGRIEVFNQRDILHVKSAVQYIAGLFKRNLSVSMNRPPWQFSG